MTFTTIYRCGGYVNATWHKAFPVATREKAEAQKAEIERGGRKAIVVETAKLDVVGLPVGWCGKCDSLTGAPTKACKHPGFGL